jgi:dihydrodipicolinate synthase/N-acetylneuraminate lyase
VSAAPVLAELVGVLPAMVTPLDQDGNVDDAGVDRLVTHVVQAGVHGVLTLGSSGEGAALGDGRRHEMIDSVTRHVAGRCPVLVGVARSSLESSIADAQIAESAGALAVLVAPPHYGPIEPDGIRAFYTGLADRLSIPVLAYNIPAFSHVALSADLVLSLAEQGAIQGLKDSSRDFDYFQQLIVGLRSRPGFRLFTGSDTLLLPALFAGAAGGITIGANVAPDWSVALTRAVADGSWTRAKELQAQLTALSIALRRGPFPAGTKNALADLGICDPWLATPSLVLTSDQRQALAADLDRLGICQSSNTPTR